jgi:hypothetical protein
MLYNLQNAVFKILPNLTMKWNMNSLRENVRASIFANFSSDSEIYSPSNITIHANSGQVSYIIYFGRSVLKYH